MRHEPGFLPNRSIPCVSAFCHRAISGRSKSFSFPIRNVFVFVAKQVRQTRSGAVKSRVQVKHPVTDRWVKVDANTGRIIDHKKTPQPYKGVRKK